MSEERSDGRIDTLIVNDAAARRQRLAEHFAAISVLDVRWKSCTERTPIASR
jgi:hypothetical protein